MRRDSVLEGGLAGPGLLRACLPQQLSRCLALPALQQAAATVYAVWCKVRLQFASPTAQEAVELGEPAWRRYWLPVIVQGLLTAQPSLPSITVHWYRSTVGV